MQFPWAQKPPADIIRVGQILNLVVTIKQNYSFKQHQYQLSSSFILLLNRLHEQVSCFPLCLAFTVMLLVYLIRIIMNN